MDKTYAEIESMVHQLQMSKIYLDLALEKDKSMSEDLAILESELIFATEHAVKKGEEVARLKQTLADEEASCTFLLTTIAELEETVEEPEEKIEELEAKIEELEANLRKEKETSVKQEEDLVELQNKLNAETESSTYFATTYAENETTIETLKSDLVKVEDDLQDEKEKMLCQICMDRPRNALCMPCRHLGYCFTCLQEHMRQSTTCPTCRNPNQEILECYI